MTNQIKYMVDRFLQWRLPDDFCPDGGISFDPVINKGTPHEHRHQPLGTYLLTAVQAEAMVRFMLDGLPAAPPRVGVTNEMVRKASIAFCSRIMWDGCQRAKYYEPAARAALIDALEAAFSTQDQAQGGHRAADTQPPGAQVDPAASAPTVGEITSAILEAVNAGYVLRHLKPEAPALTVIGDEAERICLKLFGEG